MTDVVLVHAFPLDARMWEPQLATAAAAGIRLHVLDLPGFGSSAGAALPPTLDDHADAVQAFTRARGLARFVLGGVSMGGYVAFAYLRRWGGEGRVSGLVLSNTRAEADAPEAKPGRDEMAAVARTQGMSAVADRMLPRLVRSDAPPELKSRLRAIMESQSPQATAAAVLAMRDRRDSSDLLSSIAVPTLCVAGAGDVITPPDVLRGLAARIPHARFVTIEGTAHLPNLEAPAAFDAAFHSFVRALA